MYCPRGTPELFHPQAYHFDCRYGDALHGLSVYRAERASILAILAAVHIHKLLFQKLRILGRGKAN